MLVCRSLSSAALCSRAVSVRVTLRALSSTVAQQDTKAVGSEDVAIEERLGASPAEQPATSLTKKLTTSELHKLLFTKQPTTNENSDQPIQIAPLVRKYQEHLGTSSEKKTFEKIEKGPPAIGKSAKYGNTRTAKNQKSDIRQNVDAITPTNIETKDNNSNYHTSHSIDAQKEVQNENNVSSQETLTTEGQNDEKDKIKSGAKEDDKNVHRESTANSKVRLQNSSQSKKDTRPTKKEDIEQTTNTTVKTTKKKKKKVEDPEGNGSENLPEGAKLVEFFLNEEEHDSIVKSIDEQPWQTTADSLIQRRTQQYGWRYDYAIKGTQQDMYLGPLPPFLNGVVEKMIEQGLVSREEAFNQVSVNEYVDGRGIGQHTDTKDGFGEAVASVSLLSTTVINFRQPEWEPTEPSIPVLLRPQSCLLLRGPARYDWSHGISSKNRNLKQERPPTDVFRGIQYPRSRRIAVTFRTVKHKPP